MNKTEIKTPESNQETSIIEAAKTVGYEERTPVEKEADRIRGQMNYDLAKANGAFDKPEKQNRLVSQENRSEKVRKNAKRAVAAIAITGAWLGGGKALENAGYTSDADDIVTYVEGERRSLEQDTPEDQYPPVVVQVEENNPPADK